MDRNIRIWQETRARYEYTKPQDSYIQDELHLEKYNTVPKLFPTTTIHWHEADCVDIAVSLKKRGNQPLLLNMASDYQPGGGVAKGSTAQEEELFRRSNYYKYLHRRWYPFPPKRTILSKGVEFYRAGANKEYELLETPVKLDCIAVAGIRRPECTPDHRRFLHESDALLLRQKLRILFQVAYENKNDVLVLSALGCGAFKGPIPHIAALFREIVQENQGRFREIHFAILGSTFRSFREAYMQPSV